MLSICRFTVENDVNLAKLKCYYKTSRTFCAKTFLKHLYEKKKKVYQKMPTDKNKVFDKFLMNLINL